MELNLKIKNNNVDADFLRIATELMNVWILRVNESYYRIAEIEFYFDSIAHNHADNYTHGHELQRESGRWYFHPSGVDITFGSENISGGILIRAIYNLKTEAYTYGPQKIITELFSNLPGIYSKEVHFGLIRLDTKIEDRPIAAPRVGLNRQKNEEMYNKYYRFLVLPKKQHAEKTKIAEAMKAQKYSPEEIKNIWG